MTTRRAGVEAGPRPGWITLCVGAVMLSIGLGACDFQAVTEEEVPANLSPLPEALGYEEDRAEADAAIAVIRQIPDAPENSILADSLARIEGPLLPDGAVVEPIPDSWRRTGNTAEIAVAVSLPDGAVDRFGAVMVRTTDGWRLAFTVAGPA